MPTFQSISAFQKAMADLDEDIDRICKKRTTVEQAELYRKAVESVVVAKIGSDLKFGDWKPAFQTQVKNGKNEASIVAPTKEGAGPSTVFFRGRNLGETGAMQGPGVMRSGRTSQRIKSGGAVRARASKRWNGYTYPMGSADDVRASIESQLVEIAERVNRKTLQRRVDVD